VDLRLDAQLASEPLISNEHSQWRVNGVRGYREGELFGDSGWRLWLNKKTPPLVVAWPMAIHLSPLRGSVFMDYGQNYFLDPGSRRAPRRFGGTGSLSRPPLVELEFRFLFGGHSSQRQLRKPMIPRFDFALSRNSEL